MTAEVGSTGGSVLCAHCSEGRTHGMPGSAGTISQAAASLGPHRGVPHTQLWHREAAGRSHQLTQPALGTGQQNEREAVLWAPGSGGMSYRLPCLTGRKLLASDPGLCSSVCPEAGLRPSCWGEHSGTRAAPQSADFSSLPHEIKRRSWRSISGQGAKFFMQRT